MPTIAFNEPVSPRYIHINAETNLVHLLVPVVGGHEISTDNTCKATEALKEFFDGGALRELTAYKSALVLDMGLLEAGHAHWVAKEARLVQIEAYIEAISAMRFTYGKEITALLARPSNLYSIQLRPTVPDSESRVVNPAFNIERKDNAAGVPLSPLYNAMHGIFPSVVISVNDPHTMLTTAVLGALPATPGFDDIQRVLVEQSFALYGLSIDFTKRTDGTPATKEAIDTLMSFGEDATPQDYIDALLGACAFDIWTILPAPLSPFYSIPTLTPIDERTEQLSLLTQFFLANLNVYCKAKGISTQNFGVILDASRPLSNELVGVISTALSTGDDVGTKITTFFNVNADKFGLTRYLNAEDTTAVKQTFERNYRTVTVTKENPHMDDFFLLDKEATGETAKFVTHQGAISVDFADIVDAAAAAANANYFASIRADFAAHPAEISHRNESVAGEMDVDFETLLARINDAHPAYHARHLHDVAKGRQEEAEAFLTAIPATTQTLLRMSGVFTDFSGRTFNCTAYEYAYWAKDTHMRRMLESYMDDETKAFMLTRIDAIEATGLSFQQNGEEHQSAHFDLAELKTALQAYIDGYNAWCLESNWDAIYEAWMVVGKAQRNVPAHIAQEYCRKDRSFSPIPQFNGAALPRVLTLYNYITFASESWFPLLFSNAGLGFDFALSRGVSGRAEGGNGFVVGRWALTPSGCDLAAITCLDEVRTADLTLSRDYLNVPEIAPVMAM